MLDPSLRGLSPRQAEPSDVGDVLDAVRSRGLLLVLIVLVVDLCGQFTDSLGKFATFVDSADAAAVAAAVTAAASLAARTLSEKKSFTQSYIKR